MSSALSVILVSIAVFGIGIVSGGGSDGSSDDGSSTTVGVAVAVFHSTFTGPNAKPVPETATTN